MTAANGAKITFTYDALKRLTTKTVKSGSTTVLKNAYAFKPVTINGVSCTSPLVEYHNVKDKNEAIISGAKYTYDAVGNITQISQSTGSYYPLVKYTYDAQNQLTKEEHYDGTGTATSDITKTYEYTYDTAGNILTEKVNGTVTKTYSYTDTYWGDKLTKFNNVAISYDGVGNPTSYSNGHYSFDLLWEHGRQLRYTGVDDGVGITDIVYQYDADGIRTVKNVGGNAHYYLTQGGRVVRETIGTGSTAKVLDFIYDESGRPFALKYSANGGSTFTTYYYVLNYQGDVVKLISSSGSVAASYTYNAWGEILTATGTMASINPLRHRGYYYDRETGWYYLQSRYYDPVLHRFINADTYANTGTGILGTNMFAYCSNNPVLFRDGTGKVPVETIDINNDGAIDCYVYEYSYSGRERIGMGISGTFPVKGNGRVYIYKNSSEAFLKDPKNRPADFSVGIDFMVGDFTYKKDPNIYVRDSYRCVSTLQMQAIAKVLLEYSESYAPDWHRTESSLITEWKEHNRYALFSARAKHVDFNNAEEGKGFWYFLGKAISSLF